MALSKGVFTSRQLAIQRIHSDNAYTQRSDKQDLKARVAILTAYWIRINFPELTKLANNGFAFGLANYQLAGGIETDYKALVQEYLSSTPLPVRLGIGSRSLYHWISLWLQQQKSR
jgi:hypothetical protein